MEAERGREEGEDATALPFRLLGLLATLACFLALDFGHFLGVCESTEQRTLRQIWDGYHFPEPAGMSVPLAERC